MNEHIVEIEKNVHLERLLTGDKEMQKKMQQAVKKAVQQARSRLSKEARSGLRMGSDPRAAYRAIKSAVWKRALGGSVSILSKRKASSKAVAVEPSVRGRSKRTLQLMSYYGSDRGFILRFLNAGTEDRVVNGLNNRRGFKGDYDSRNGHRKYKGGIGNRGRIEGRNWFGNASEAQLMRAAEEMEKIIEQAIAEANV